MIGPKGADGYNLAAGTHVSMKIVNIFVTIQIFQDIIHCRCDIDGAASGFLKTASQPIFAPISNACPRFFITFMANFLPVLADAFTNFGKRLPGPSALIVLSSTNIDFLELHSTHFQIKNFPRLGVILHSIDEVAD